MAHPDSPAFNSNKHPVAFAIDLDQGFHAAVFTICDMLRNN